MTSTSETTTGFSNDIKKGQSEKPRQMENDNKYENVIH